VVIDYSPAAIEERKRLRAQREEIQIHDEAARAARRQAARQEVIEATADQSKRH
jgi:hypothetical protein